MTRRAVFPELHSHIFETEPEDNHIIHLVKAVAQEYIEICLYHWGKELQQSNQWTKGPKKLVHFLYISNDNYTGILFISVQTPSSAVAEMPCDAPCPWNQAVTQGHLKLHVD